jgi:1-acyl-sn-glycerol-3-phosphate acyltransferase
MDLSETMSLYHLALAARDTFRISAWVIWAGNFGTLNDDDADRWLDWWAERVLSDAQIELDVVGREHARADETYVIMSNHQSLYDIPVIFQALKRRIRMVAKKELFYVPVWAQAMRRAGFVEVDRKRRDRAIESLGRAEEALREGRNIWIAPEGTRSKTGQLGPFKKGGFHLAINSGAKILPVTIRGTRDALPADGWRVREGARVQVTISPPLDTADYGLERRDALIAAVRDAIEQPLLA